MPTDKPVIQAVVTQDLKDWIAAERVKNGLSESAFVQLILRKFKAGGLIEKKNIKTAYDPSTGEFLV